MSHEAVVIGPDTVDAIWADGERTALPNLWLRHNCTCDECQVTQTEERRFTLDQVPADLAPASAELANGVLSITWPDGHQTAMTRGAVQQAVAGRPVPDLQLWNSDFAPPRVDHDAFFGDDAAAIDAIEAFLRTGVLVVTGSPTEPNSLEGFARRLGPMREMHFARIHNVEVDPAGYNVAHTNLPLPPHNDFAGMSWPPSIQALHMLANDVEGGQSVVTDGFAILEGLRADEPEMFEVLCSVPIPFRMFDPTTETYSSGPLVQLEPDGSIRRLRFSNQVMQAADPTQPRMAEFYRAYQELTRRILDRSNQARFRLEGGHVLVVAAHRVLHARDKFVADGRRHLQDAYFEHDNLRNALWVLKRDQVA